MSSPRPTRRRFLGGSLALTAGAVAVPSLSSPAFADGGGHATDVYDFSSRATFDQMDLQLGDDRGKHDNNYEGMLAWRMSHVLMSYVLMYRAHRDLEYLDKFIDHADAVLASRDSETGDVDYRGLSLPAWQARIYSVDLAPLIGAVDTGMICRSYIWFARMVYATPELRDDAYYREKADEYTLAVEQAVAVHDFQWRTIGSDKGTYFFPKGQPFPWDGMDLAHNQNHTMAMCLLHLWAVTQEPVYKDRVERLLRLFRSDLRLGSSGQYLWNYHWTQSWGYRGWTEADGVSENAPSFAGNRRPEDSHHAHHTIEFIGHAVRDGLVFTTSDLHKFAQTFEGTVVEMDYGTDVTRYVDGTGGAREGSEGVSAGSWAPAGRFSPEFVDVTQAIYTHQVDAALPGRLARMMVGSAHLNDLAQGGRGGHPGAPVPPRRHVRR